MSQIATDRRLTALEQEVAQIKRRLNRPGSSPPAVEGDDADVTQCLEATGVEVSDAPRVARYLRAHPDLLAPITSSIENARSGLPAGTNLTLTLYRDPDAEDEYMTLYARRTEYEEPFLDALYAVSDACDALFRGMSGRLLLTTDFRPV